MRITIVSSPRSAHQLTHQSALADGFMANGISAQISIGGRVDTDYVACWGWRLGRSFRAQGKRVLVMERGYIGDRFAWTSLAWDGLNGNGKFPNLSDPSRFNENFSMRPWKSGGEFCLIMGQVPGDAALSGRNLFPWYSEIAKLARTKYDLPVFFRHHPQALLKGHNKLPKYTELSSGTLYDALDSAAVAITFNSNSAVDAVLYGVPSLSFDKGSMAYSVTGHKLGEILTPDRSEWAARLAWKQWKMDEIRNGTAVSQMLKAL